MISSIPPEASLLGLPRELRDKIYKELFQLGPTLIVGDNMKLPLPPYLSHETQYRNADVEGKHGFFQLTKTLPMHALLINRLFCKEAKELLVKQLGETRVVIHAEAARGLAFIECVPGYVGTAIKRLYLTSTMLYSNDWVWQKSTYGPSPIVKAIVRNLRIKELAMFVPQLLSDESMGYSRAAPYQVCALLELSAGRLQKVQFVYEAILPRDTDCNELYEVLQVQGGLDKEYYWTGGKVKLYRIPKRNNSSTEVQSRFLASRESSDIENDDTLWADKKPRTIVALSRRFQCRKRPVSPERFMPPDPPSKRFLRDLQEIP